MNSHDQWIPSFFDQADLPAGQSPLDFEYMAEPRRLDGERFETDEAMALSVDAVYLDQNIPNSYSHFVPSIAPFDGFGYHRSMSPKTDSHDQLFDVFTPRWSRSPPQVLEREPGMTRSTSSTETECSNEEDQQRHICQECNKLFRNLQDLDQHAKGVPHRAWRCAEPFCEKTYARRDTFLRHRATHKDKSHSCPVCPGLNKQKVFKRKDHLREHIRNCHPKGAEAMSVEGVKYA